MTQPLFAAIASARHHAYLVTCRQPLAARQALQEAARQVLSADQTSGVHPDLTVVHPNEKGTIVVDTIRDATSRLFVRSAHGGAKVLLIPDAGAMNPQAQNAFLKVLEEPPGHCVLLLAARSRKLLLPTLRSRMLHIALPVPELSDAQNALQGAGLPEALIPTLATLCGPDVEAATQLVEAGLEDVTTSIRAAMESTDPVTLTRTASDLGQNESTYRLALRVLEMETSRRLQKGQSAKLTCVVDALWRLRQNQAIHLNRTLALESALLPLAAR